MVKSKLITEKSNKFFTYWQAMQTCTCFAILAGLHRPKCLLRDNPQVPKIIPFGDGCASCGR